MSYGRALGPNVSNRIQILIAEDTPTQPRMSRAHEELLLNRFRAKAEISSAVEGLNKTIRFER